MDVPSYAEPLIVTDAAVNIAPTLEEKVDIIQNAIDLAHALQFPEVRVAILSAMETVNPKVPSTVEAGALCKMADRGQITGAILDGPLALDNAISLESVKIKKIESPVAGRANVSSRPRSRSRQHAGEKPVVPRGSRRGGHRARSARTHHPHEPGGLAADASRVLCGGRAGREGSPRRAARKRWRNVSDAIAVLRSRPGSARTARPCASGGAMPCYRLTRANAALARQYSKPSL